MSIYHSLLHNAKMWTFNSLPSKEAKTYTKKKKRSTVCIWALKLESIKGDTSKQKLIGDIIKAVP